MYIYIFILYILLYIYIIYYIYYIYYIYVIYYIYYIYMLYICIYVYIRVNYKRSHCDLTANHGFYRGIIPKWPNNSGL